MLLCNPAIKQPTAALMQPYRIHPIGQIPYRNPVILRSRNRSTIQIYLTPQNDSILNQGHFISEHIFCQSTQNTLTVFRVNVTARQAFTTWQAGHCHPCLLHGKQCRIVRVCYFASRADPYRFCYLASRVQNAICKFASSVRMAVHYLASSVQIRTCAQFLHRLVGNTSQAQRSHFV